jgi:hypothetical protein
MTASEFQGSWTWEPMRTEARIQSTYFKEEHEGREMHTNGGPNAFDGILENDG